MDLVYPPNEGTKLRHHIEQVDSMWYAEFETPDQVKYTIEGKLHHGTPEEFVKDHYAAVISPTDIWKECKILHEGVWKSNPTKDRYIDLTETEDDDEEILLQPSAS